MVCIFTLQHLRVFALALFLIPLHIYLYMYIFAFIFITSVRTRRARSLPAWILFCKASNTILALPHAFCLTPLSLLLSWNFHSLPLRECVCVNYVCTYVSVCCLIYTSNETAHVVALWHLKCCLDKSSQHLFVPTF